MNETQRGAGLITLERLLLAAGAAATILLAFGALFDVRAALGGLLFGFLFWLGIPVGSMVLLDIHALTGGGWGEAARPILTRCARLVPFFAVPYLLILLGAPSLYAWAGSRAAAKELNEAYLNVPAFGLRGIAIFVVWTLIAWLPHSRRNPQIWSGLALTAYGVSVTIAAVDWSMSLTPKWSSSAYAAFFAIGQITAAFAFAGVSRIGTRPGQANADLSAFLIAGALGIVYLGFMQYLVTWAGNLPDKAAYYVARLQRGFKAMETTALVIGGAVPLLLLLRRRARRSGVMTALAGLAVLLGLALDWLWQLAPSLPGSQAWAFVLGWLGIGGITLGFMGRTSPFRQGHRSAAHA